MIDGERPFVYHYRLIRKLVMDFLFVFIELFALSVTAEALQASIK